MTGTANQDAPPRVTLAMPVFNGERYIEEAIQSARNQTYADFELIITDNASTDRTPEICRRLAAEDGRIRYCPNDRNLGAAPNYNRGFELARGEFLKWCAHDDRLSDRFLERCVETLDARPDVSLAFARTQCIDSDGAFIPWDERSVMSAIEDDDPAERFFRAIVGAGTCFPIFGVFRTSVLRQSTLHRSYYGSDRALIAEAALFGKVAQVADDAVFFNREHETRSINMTDQAERSRWQDTSAGRRAAMEHVNLLLHLIEIARRHSDLAPTRRVLGSIARYATHRRQLGRYALDLVRYVSPGAALRLKTSFQGGRGG